MTEQEYNTLEKEVSDSKIKLERYRELKWKMDKLCQDEDGIRRFNSNGYLGALDKDCQYIINKDRVFYFTSVTFEKIRPILLEAIQQSKEDIQRQIDNL